MIHNSTRTAKNELNIIVTKLRSLREDLMKREKVVQSLLNEPSLSSEERVGILTVINSLDLLWHRLDSMEADLVFSQEFLKTLEGKNATIQ